MVAASRVTVNRIATSVSSLGPGRRVGLWVQGCTIGCAGCASTDTWDATAGVASTVTELAGQLGHLLDDADGLTITGGEPFQQGDALAQLVGILRSGGALDHRDLLIFTGYAATAARRRSPTLWEQADALVAGPYRQARPNGGWLRASDNQELVLRTPLAEQRYSTVPSAGIDVALSGSDMVMAGLPDSGDLDRFRQLMTARGIDLGGVTWQS